MFLFITPQTIQTDPEEEIKKKDDKVHHLKDVVVIATRTDNAAFDAPANTSVVSEKDIKRKMSRSTPEALKEVPNIMVQKTSHGQGSPYIRGFTSFRTLFMVDGIRLNNSAFRPGPNQYWNTVDALSLSRMEIAKGPSSVLYGSDAVGGAVNALTPELKRGEEDSGFSWERRLYYRFSTAEHSHVGRFEVNGQLNDDFSFLLGLTLKDFGNVRAGGGTNEQPKTGYGEADGDFKLRYFLDSDSSITLAHQDVNINDAWRTHKTVYGINWEGTTNGSDLKRSFDQDRSLTYLKYDRKNLSSFFEKLNLTFSYQEQEEERHRYRSNLKTDKQGFELGTMGFSIQMDTPVHQTGRWTWGLEYYRDHVDSFKNSWNADGSFSGSSIQGPVADNSTYDLLGVYLQDEIPLNESLDLILGARYTYAAANVDKYEDPVTNQEASLREKWGSFVSSARLICGLDEQDHWNLFTGVSQGFRAPNLSDLTRLDSSGSTWQEIPSPDLKPEKFVSYEMGVKTDYEDLKGQVSYFYTDIHDMILRTATGNTLPSGELEVTKTNAGEGYVHGIELDGSYRFLPQFTALAAFGWIYGAADNYPSVGAPKKKEPLSRLMPVTTHLGVRWDEEEDLCWLEGICTIATKADKLSTRDEGDTDRIPPGGTPGYMVFSLRSGWNVTDDLTLTAAIENITNENYRVHGSGLNEPGTNLLVSMDWRF